MTDWQPSEGLRRADAVVAEIEQALEACGIAVRGHPSRPILSHRLTEIVAKAIDEATGASKTASAHVNANGHANGHAITVTPTPGLPAGSTVTYVAPVMSGVITKNFVVDDAPAKRRGRPKGSTKKKAKPAKGDKAPEAPPVAE